MPGMYRVYAIYISPAFWIFGVRQPRLEKVVCCFPRINLLDSCVLILEQKQKDTKIVVISRLAVRVVII